RGMEPSLISRAAAVAEEVEVPECWGCCGFAGDRGMLQHQPLLEEMDSGPFESTSRSDAMSKKEYGPPETDVAENAPLQTLRRQYCAALPRYEPRSQTPLAYSAPTCL